DSEPELDFASAYAQNPSATHTEDSCEASFSRLLGWSSPWPSRSADRLRPAAPFPAASRTRRTPSKSPTVPATQFPSANLPAPGPSLWKSPACQPRTASTLPTVTAPAASSAAQATISPTWRTATRSTFTSRAMTPWPTASSPAPKAPGATPAVPENSKASKAREPTRENPTLAAPYPATSKATTSCPPANNQDNRRRSSPALPRRSSFSTDSIFLLDAATTIAVSVQTESSASSANLWRNRYWHRRRKLCKSLPESIWAEPPSTTPCWTSRKSFSSRHSSSIPHSQNKALTFACSRSPTD